MNYPPNFKHGDWMCKCGQHNFSSKTHCHKCGIPKEEGNVSNDTNKDQNSNGLTLLTLPHGFRPGDWMCKCSQHNYSSKKECHSCKLPKDEADVTNTDYKPFTKNPMGFGGG